MISPSDARHLLKPQVGAALTFLTMLALSWQRWTGMITDIGRETDLPLRLLNGEVLYRDIHYMYGPFSPYFNAFLYRTFGAELQTLTFSGIAISILVALLIYRIARRLLPAPEASLSTALVIALCLFKLPGNMVLPYAFAASHALVFSLTTVVFTLRYFERGKRRELILAGIFIGLAGITKQEFAFASAVTVTAALVYRHRTEVRKLASGLASAAIPALVVAAPVFASLFATIDWRILIEDCHLFLTHLPESIIIYNRFRSGLDYPMDSLLQLIGATALGIAFVASITLISDRHGVLRKKLAVTLTSSVILAATVLITFLDQWDGSPLRALPVFLVGIIVVAWKRRSSTGSHPGPGIAETHELAFIVAVYSLSMLLRVILRVPSGGFSGNALIPASIVLVSYVLLRTLPDAIGRWTGDALSGVRARKIACGFLIILTIALMVSFGTRFRVRNNYEIAGRHGTLFVNEGVGSILGQTLEFIERNTAEHDVIAVLPEGNDLAFLTGRRINLRHQVLIPDFMSVEDELEAIAALDRDQVQYIFVLNQSMEIFGHVAFGRDFYQTLGNWIEDNYEVIDIPGLTEGQTPVIGEGPFFIKIYERRAS